MDIFLTLRFSHYGQSVEAENAFDWQLLWPILLETGIPHPARLSGLFQHRAGALFCTAALACWQFGPEPLLDLYCDIHFQSLPGDAQLLVRAPLVAVVRRTILRGLAMAGFLSVKELVQKDRTVLDFCGADSAPNFSLILR